MRYHRASGCGDKSIHNGNIQYSFVIGMHIIKIMISYMNAYLLAPVNMSMALNRSIDIGLQNSETVSI